MASALLRCRRRARLRARVLGLLLGAAALPAARAEQPVPVPSVTIYPGDIIRDAMLTERPMPDDFAGRTVTVLDRSAMLGKTARRTLLPGLPVPLSAVAEPKVVTVGAMVRVVFVEGGLTITTYGSALQAGAVGDTVSVRNSESGLTVSGRVDRDGTIRVNNG